MSHFPCFSVLLTIFQVIQCLCFVFHVFQFSCHIPGKRVFLFHFPRFSFISPYSRSDSVFVTFSTFCIFIAIYQVRQCAFLIFHVFQCFLPYSRYYHVSFSFLLFYSVSHHIPDLIVFWSHFPHFSFFGHNPGATVCISHCSRF